MGGSRQATQGTVRWSGGLAHGTSARSEGWAASHDIPDPAVSLGDCRRLQSIMATQRHRPLLSPEATLTSIRMDWRTASGNLDQAATTAAKWGSVLQVPVGKWWATLGSVCRKSFGNEPLKEPACGLIIRRSGVRVPHPGTSRTSPSSPDDTSHLRQTHQGPSSRPNPTLPGPSRSPALPVALAAFA